MAHKPKAKPSAKSKTKQQTVVDLISRPHGASLNELMEATGWQKHTCRAVISVEKKKLGLKVELVEGRYGIVATE